MNLAEVSSRLTVKHRRGDTLDCVCPAHEDRVASLTVNEAPDGKILVKCHAGCETSSVLAAIGIEWADLWPDDGSSAPSTKVRPIDPSIGTPTASYVYTDEENDPLFRVVRYDMGEGKKRFVQQKATGEGAWAHNLGDARKVLYRLSAVREAAAHGRRVLYVEGEKDVHTLERLGFIATTHAGGAGAWKTDYAPALEGAEVVILPDNDVPGKKLAQAILKDVRGSRVLDLPNLPEKGDVSDWVAAGGTRETLLKLLGPEISDMNPVGWEQFQQEKETLTYFCGDVIADETVNILVADAGVGKTTLVNQLCLSIASGYPFLGFMKTKQVPVLLLEAEGARSLFRARAELARQALRIPAESLRGNWSIQSRWVSDFDAGNLMVDTQIRRSGAKLVVLDTLGYFFGDGDENSAKDWKKKIMFPLRRYRALYGCSFIVIHHEGKPGELRTGHHKGRGTSAMFGDCDTWFSIENFEMKQGESEIMSEGQKEESENEKTLCWYKSKVGKKPKPITLNLDVDNAIFTVKMSSVREELDAAPKARRTKRDF